MVINPKQLNEPQTSMTMRLLDTRYYDEMEPFKDRDIFLLEMENFITDYPFSGKNINTEELKTSIIPSPGRGFVRSKFSFNFKRQYVPIEALKP